MLSLNVQEAKAKPGVQRFGIHVVAVSTPWSLTRTQVSGRFAPAQQRLLARCWFVVIIRRLQLMALCRMSWHAASFQRDASSLSVTISTGNSAMKRRPHCHRQRVNSVRAISSDRIIVFTSTHAGYATSPTWMVLSVLYILLFGSQGLYTETGIHFRKGLWVRLADAKCQKPSDTNFAVTAALLLWLLQSMFQR